MGPEEALKDKEAFRDYIKDDELGARVKKTYYDMHTNQTMEFVTSKQEKWLKFNHMEATVMEALDMLNELVDESDPDLDLPNIIHAFQTAERIREFHPDKDWFHLVGLIHDMGKIMAFYGEPQWAVVGDTFPVGCKHAASIVFGEESFKHNKDVKDARYNTKLGMYKEGCGMENVVMSWGHDEYLYQVLMNHMDKVGTHIPKEGKDKEITEWVLEFNKFDLYTKSTKVPDIEALRPYYQSLVDKYLPGRIAF